MAREGASETESVIHHHDDNTQHSIASGPSDFTADLVNYMRGSRQRDLDDPTHESLRFSTLQAANSRINELEMELSTSRTSTLEKLRALSADKDKAHQDYNSLNLYNEELHGRILGLETEQKDLKREIVDLQNINADLKRVSDNLNESNRKTLLNATSLDATNHELVSTVETLKTAITASNEQFEQKTRSLSILKDTLDVNLKGVTDTNEHFEHANKLLGLKIDQMREENNALSNRVADLFDSREFLSQTRKQIDTSAEALVAQKRPIEERITDLVETNNNLLESNRTLVQKLDLLNTDVEKIHSQVKSLNLSNEGLKVENQRLTRLNEALPNADHHPRSRLPDSGTALMTIQEQLREQTAKGKELELKLALQESQHAQDKESRTRQIDELKEELNEVYERLSKAVEIEKFNEVKETAQRHRMAKDASRVMVDNLKSSLGTLQAAKAQMEANAQKSELEVQDLHMQNTNLRAMVSSSRRENHQLRDQICNVEGHYLQLKGQYARLLDEAERTADTSNRLAKKVLWDKGASEIGPIGAGMGYRYKTKDPVRE